MADEEEKGHKAEQLKLTQSSCLSKGVFDLICGLNLEYTRGFTREDDNVVSLLAGKSVMISQSEERMQLLIAIAKLSLAKNSEGVLNFAETVKNLIPFVHYVHEQLIQLNVKEFEGKFGMDLEWTANMKRILECFKLLKDCDVQPVNIIASSLLLFTILERSLGDVYASHTGLRSPTNLKDLFISKGIQELLGENVCLIFYAIAGPPESVNLRNVIWHGFISPGEIPPQYISFLIFTMAAIGSRFTGIKIERRPLIKLTGLERLHIFPNIVSSEFMSAIRDLLLTSSLFVSPSMLPVWGRALQYHEDKRYDLALVLLLPLLENALRMVFAHVNKCPKRILTAESTTLYTTFDEILAPLLPDGTENQLRKEIGDEFLQMLLDILAYTDGPRIRDRISHGEVDLASISSDMSNHVLSICIAFASMFAPASMENLQVDMNKTDAGYAEIAGNPLPIEKSFTADESAEKNSASDSSLPRQPGSFMEVANIQSCSDSNMDVMSYPNTVCQIILKARSYQSVYHPNAMLKSDIKDLSIVIQKWKLIPLPETEFEKTSDSDLLEAQEKMLRILRIILDKGNKCFLNGVNLDAEVDKMLDDEQFSSSIFLLCDNSKVAMLFRPRKELEVVSLFSSIVNHCNTASVQVLNTAHQRYQQWSKKELRSRQRANYKRLLSLLPCFKNVIKVVLVFILIELPSLQENATDAKQAGHVKYLKRCLQSTENLKSLSGPSKNKWDECKVVGEQLITMIQEHFSCVK